MKLHIPVILAALLAALAQTSLRADEADDHDALRELKTIYEKAASEGKPDLLQPYLDPEFTGVMVTGAEVKSFDDIKEYWDYIQGLLGEGGTYKVTVTVAEDAYIDGNLAVSRGATKDVAVTSSGQEFQFSSHWTAVCRRHEGEWKIYRIQGSMDPINNPFVAAARSWAIMLTGVAAGVGGLVLGCLACLGFYRLRRNKPSQESA